MLNVQVLRLPPEMLEELIEGKKVKELFEVVYLAKIHPDENDISQVAAAQVTCHLFAQDATEALQLFSANVPDELPVLHVMHVRAVPGVSADSVIEIARGPRVIH